MELIQPTDRGLYCEQGDFYVDPWRPVDFAVITHAHADHSRWGMRHYLAHHQSGEVMKLRLGKEISLQTIGYGQPVFIRGVRVSLHPAGHIPGSAQVRIEYKGRVEVVSGDYKIEYDGLSTPFEPVPCHGFVSECTFGLPIYRWDSQEVVFKQMNAWWEGNASRGLCSVIFAYSLGKAQRIARHLDPSIGPVWLHGAVWNTNQALKISGVDLPDFERVGDAVERRSYGGAMIIAPPSAIGTPWLKKLTRFRTAVCSGWMNVRGTRRRRAVDTGFVLSDHADWTGLTTAIDASEAEEVWLTHGFTDSFSRYLLEKGINASVLETHFQGEASDAMD